MARKRRQFTFLVTVSVHPDVTKGEAKRDLRAMVQTGVGYHSVYRSGRYADEGDVRLSKVATFGTITDPMLEAGARAVMASSGFQTTHDSLLAEDLRGNQRVRRWVMDARAVIAAALKVA